MTVTRALLDNGSFATSPASLERVDEAARQREMFAPPSPATTPAADPPTVAQASSPDSGARRVHVLGLDPGFANLGWFVLDMQGDRARPVACGVQRTQKESAKAKLLAVEDNLRRVREMVGRIDILIKLHDVRAVCAESMSFPRSASVAAKVAMVWGAIVALCEVHRLPLLQCTPQAVKRFASGSASASKDDVARAVIREVGLAEAVVPGLEAVPRSLHEHAWDAAAVAMVCARGDLIRAMRGAS